MSRSKYKFPAFETLELNTGVEYNYQSYQKLNPAKVGDTLTELANRFNRQQINIGNSIVSLNHFHTAHASKIKVVYFYSSEWGEVSLLHLKQLHAIRNEVKYHDGNLLIIDADGDSSTLQQTLWLNNLQLPVHSDTNHQLAKLFNIYADNSPAWSRYSGLDKNVPLPSIFVLDHKLQIIYALSNEDIVTNIKVDEITNAVYLANNYLAGRKTA
jgi:peroxiredoxin